MKLKQTALGVMLLATALSSSALSIGRVRGAAWIGQALDVTVPVRLDASEDGSTLCFDADVFHADTKVDPRNVRIITDSAPANPGEARDIMVRVRSALIVDEPVVTLYLKVGCDQKITRRLVLLAELPTETSSALAAAPLPVIPVPSLVAPAPTPPVAPPAPRPVRRAPVATEDTGAAPVARAPRPARPPAAVPAPAPSVTAQAVAPAPAPATAPVAKAPAPAPAPKAAPAPAPQPTSRLKLDPVEPPPAIDGSLKTTPMISGTPEDNDQKRAEAAALWRSINAQPEDVLRDSQRLQSLESSINSLRSQMMQNQTNISDLKTQLAQAQNERYANPLVYALGALLLAAIAAIAFLWQRGRKGGGARNADWWRDVDHRSPVTVQVPPLNEEEGLQNVRTQATVRTRAPSAPAPQQQNSRPPVQELDLDLGFDDGPPPDMQHTVAIQPVPLPRRTMHTDFASSFGGSGRSVNTEELFDIHQQADFFLSLGQHEQAIGVLMGHIRDNPETSALAYLDLFKIYHQLNRREQYDQLRNEFHSAFNADVPEFEAFNEKGRGLEQYGDTLNRIVELWGSPDVITLVEELIFRRPDDTDDGQTFDLEAYKELLLLFAVALEVSEDDDGFVVSGPDSAFAVMGGPLTVPPSLDDSLPRREATNSLPPLPQIDDSAAPNGSVNIDLMLSDSMVAPISSLPTPRAGKGGPATAPATFPVPVDAPGAPKSGDNSIDFDLFDPSIESEITPKKKD